MTTAAQAPLVSIVVPNYNYARYLNERMNSIFNQTLKDYEIILLDDASTDGSLDILKEYAKDPRVASLTVNATNTGLPFLQWKKGIDRARGKYIWIAESDDSCTPEFLATCVAELEKNPNAMIAFTGSNTIDENGNPGEMDYDQWYGKKFISRLGNAKSFDGERYVTHNMAWRNYVYNASGTVFRRDAVSACDNLDTCFNMRNAGDWFFWTALMQHGEVIEIYRKLNKFRRHTCSQTAKGIANGAINGNIYLEDMTIRKFITSEFKMNFLRKILIKGNLYKALVRSDVTPTQKKELLNTAKKELHMSKATYVIDRINKFFWNFIPGIISMKNDRL